MKKRILMFFLLVVISAVSFFSLFQQENYFYLYRMGHFEEIRNSYRISITSGNKSHEEMYSVLKELLDEYQGNIFFTRLDENSQKSSYKKYIYLTDLHYFNGFWLKSGRLLSLEEMESDKFLCTTDMGSNLQIGQIMDFAGDDVFRIHTLKSMVDEDTGFDGNAILQLGEPQNIEMFIEKLNQEGVYCTKEVIYPEPPLFRYLYYLSMLVLYLIMSILVFYDILSSYKKIGAYKMFGYSNSAIWMKFGIPVISKLVIVFSAVCIISIPIMIKDYNEYFWSFLTKLALQSIVLFVLTILFTLIPFIYLPRITIPDMLKNKQPVNEIVITNTVIKTVLSVFLVISVISVYSQYTVLFFQYSNTNKIWEATKNYAVIPSISDISNDFLISAEFRKAQKELYMYFNEKGAILADFDRYSPIMREEYSKKSFEGYKSDCVEVNPNYLKSNLVYDSNHEKIDIDESESDYVLLIPEKYRPNENEIRQYYNFVKNGYGKNSIVRSQNIKIIWTEMNQELFTYRIDINPSEWNRVKDPVIRVITENNGDITNYDKIIGYSGNPFKIRVEDPSNPSASIRPILFKYGLSKYIKSISSVFDYIAAQAKNIIESLMFTSIFILLLGTLIIIILMQNIYSYFEQNKMRLAIQQFHGYKRMDRYDSFLTVTSISWLIVVIISVFIKHGYIYQILLLCIACMMSEIVLSILVFIFVEKSKLAKVIKGG